MFKTAKEKKKSIFRHLGKIFEGYKKYTVLTMVFGCAEVMLEVLIPMLMSVIVDGGLYREEDCPFRYFRRQRYWQRSPFPRGGDHKNGDSAGQAFLCKCFC